jgi:hypothetical protein
LTPLRTRAADARFRRQFPWKYVLIAAFSSIALQLNNHPFTMTTISAARVPPRKRPYTFAA